ncbi:replication initiation protein, partial [Sulfuricurvum sp.]|uniref:replication initiation protein n=1 Tax=Sulfuricurvum sp. TaxID=2025608 RepID=UPI00199EAAF4
LTNYTDRHLDRFVKNIDSTYKKLLESNIRIETEKEIIRFVLFTKFRIDKDKKIVTIATNKEFEYILNALTSNFTRFELAEFISLSKTNSKTLYRKLKQFRKTGFWVVDYKEFLELMGLTKWNRTDINKEINRIVEDVTPFFQNLELKKIKKNNTKTGAIQRLEFSFEPEIQIIEQLEQEVPKLEQPKPKPQITQTKNTKTYFDSFYEFKDFLIKNYKAMQQFKASSLGYNQDVTFSITQTGYIMNNYSGKLADKEDAFEIWEALYKNQTEILNYINKTQQDKN